MIRLMPRQGKRISTWPVGLLQPDDFCFPVRIGLKIRFAGPSTTSRGRPPHS